MTAQAAGGTLTAPGEDQRHEVRVFPGACDGSLTLRCCCGEAWNLEPGHTTGELDALAGQHAGGTQ